MCKIPKSVLTLAFAIALSIPAVGQEIASDRIRGLDRKECFDACAVGKVVFAYERSGLPKSENAVRDLSKLVSVERASTNSRPVLELQLLIDQECGMSMDLSIASVAAINNGDCGFVWKSDFVLRPTSGDSAGAPYHFIAYVKPDGSILSPKLFLCDSKMVSEETPIFSVLSFEDLKESSKIDRHIKADEALKSATNSVETLRRNAMKTGLTLAWRFHDQRLIEIPIAAMSTGEIERCSVWQVRYNLSSPASVALFESEPLSIWVTTDGMVSELSLETWQSKNRRLKP